jgi:hypothetical protein
LTSETLEQTQDYIEQLISSLPRAQSQRSDAALLLEEFRWVAQMLGLACRLGKARLADGIQPLSAMAQPEGQLIGRELKTLIEVHERLWLRRNRPGGLKDSSARLKRLLPYLMSQEGASSEGQHRCAVEGSKLKS